MNGARIDYADVNGISVADSFAQSMLRRPNVAAGGRVRRFAHDAFALHAFGANNNAQLGLGACATADTPKRVPINYNVVGIATSDKHTIIVSAYGDVSVCGIDTHGRLGLGDAKGAGQVCIFCLMTRNRIM